MFGLTVNALGVQQIPPNIALNALAIILSTTSWRRSVIENYDLVAAAKPNFASVDRAEDHLQNPAGDRWRALLEKHAADREKAFFLKSARTLWPKKLSDGLTANSMAIVLPAFTVSQLREAFEIGFLLYLPFIAIDLIVANILLALGMIMVSSAHILTAVQAVPVHHGGWMVTANSGACEGLCALTGKGSASRRQAKTNIKGTSMSPNDAINALTEADDSGDGAFIAANPCRLRRRHRCQPVSGPDTVPEQQPSPLPSSLSPSRS